MRNNKGQNNPNWKGGKPKCPICQKELYRRTTKTCKLHQPKLGTANPNFKHGLTFNKTCKCGVKISYYNDRCWSCWKKELSERYKLDGNPAWEGGKSFEPYPIGWNKTFKEQIRFRDEYKCQLCYTPEIECIRKLSVHHIDYNKNNIKLENLISLCGKCHSKTRRNKVYWMKLFKEKMYLLSLEKTQKHEK
jgi:hypothetical protein